jgi:DNA-binding transcriptional ArsR family regulator
MTRADLDRTFAALADPTRRAILERLARGEATVAELARPFRISAPAISRHLRVLEQAGLMQRERDAQWHRCRLNAQALAHAMQWLAAHERFWADSLQRLEQHLKPRRNAHGKKRR